MRRYVALYRLDSHEDGRPCAAVIAGRSTIDVENTVQDEYTDLLSAMALVDVTGLSTRVVNGGVRLYTDQGVWPYARGVNRSGACHTRGAHGVVYDTTVHPGQNQAQDGSCNCQAGRKDMRCYHWLAARLELTALELDEESA